MSSLVIDVPVPSYPVSLNMNAYKSRRMGICIEVYLKYFYSVTDK